MNICDFKIREATTEDLPIILDLYRFLDTDPQTELDEQSIILLFGKMKEYPYHKIFVVERNTVIVGTFTLTIIDYLIHQGKKAGVMEAVVVDPAFRSQGIGKQMVSYALSECKSKNCYKMSLSSNINREKAHAFYESQGFKLHGYSFYTD